MSIVILTMGFITKKNIFLFVKKTEADTVGKTRL